VTVVRRRHNGSFTIIPNQVMDDKRLSLDAKGLHCWLLSRPPDWTFKLARIAPLLGIGRDKIERLFRELIEAGYVDRIQERTDGRWGPVDYVVFDDPERLAKRVVGPETVTHHDTAAAPHPEKPVPVKPVPENTGAYIKRIEDNKTTADDARTREPSKSLISAEAFALCADLLRLQHLEADDPRCIGIAYGVQAWLSNGWNADLIKQTVEAVMARRTSAPRSLRYFEQAIADTHAERERSLPTANPPANRNFNGTHRQGGLIRHAIKLAEQASNDKHRSDHSGG
jgi:hypothetical protein